MRRHRMSRRTPGIVALALLSATLVLTEVLSAAHHRPSHSSSRVVAATDVVDIAGALQLLTGTRITTGNRVELLLNGDGTFPSLWRDLAAARRTIVVQMYYVKPGRVADTMATVLCGRARAGVRALLLVDAFGSVDASRSWIRRMRDCGVEVAALRKLQWYTIHSATDRSHVRAVIVDGRIGYTGGFGLADYWLGDGRRENQWRESNTRFEGPAVASLQAAFAAAWMEATGELIEGEDFFPRVDSLPTSGVDAGVLFATPTVGSTAAERFLSLAIRSARRRLYIANSYFVPNAEFRRLLAAAAARGVDVRILTAGAKTDVRMPWLAGRFRYDELSAEGVRIYEYEPSMMHAKTMVVDDAWGTIGSMNFDNHSLAFNEESNLVVLDSAFAARMDSVFFEDLRHAQEMTPAVLAARSIWERMLEGGAVVLSRIL